MADVNNRGQLILVTALAIAVMLVGMVLLLNTVIYAENLATRGADIGGQDTVEYRQIVITGVGDTVDHENERDHESYSEVHENVSAAIGRLDELIAQKHLSRSELVEISNVTLTNGTLLTHPKDTDGFNATGGASDWMLVSDVTATRGFVLSIDSTDVSGGSAGNGFQVVVEDGAGEQWKLFVYDDGATTVSVKNGSEGGPTVVCSSIGPAETVDLTTGKINGEHCPGIVFGKGITSPYSISFVNGDRIGGTYELTVNRKPTDPSIQANFDMPSSESAPRYAYAIYDVTVDVRYRTNVIRYTDQIRIAPGESS